MAQSKIDKFNELIVAIKEMQELAKTAKSDILKDILSVQLQKLESLKILRYPEQCEYKDEKKGKEIKKVNKIYTVKLTDYAWDQTDKYVEIFISLKDVHEISAENIKCVFDEYSMELNVRNLNEKNFTFLNKSLFDKINISGSSWKIKPNKIIIKLCKQSEGTHWSYVTSTEQKISDLKANKLNDEFETDEDSSSPDSLSYLNYLMKELEKNEIMDDEMNDKKPI